MGRFNKLFDFLGNNYKSKSTNVLLNVSALSEWLELEEKKQLTKLNFDNLLNIYTNKLKDTRWLFECKLDDWDECIKKENFEFKEDVKTIFNETRNLLDLLTFMGKVDLETIRKLNMILELKIENLIKKIEKSSFSNNFLFLLSVEEQNNKTDGRIMLNPLMSELINLKNIRDDFTTKINGSGWNSLEVLKNKIIEIEEHNDKIKALNKDLENKKERHKQVENKINKKNLQLADLKNNPKFVDIEEINLNQKNLTDELCKIEDSVFIFFSQFKTLLKQFIKLNPNHGLAKRYYEQATIYFYEDKNLDVLTLFKQLKEILHFQKIKLNVSETNNLLDKIEQANTGYLKKLQSNYYLIKEKLNKLNQIDENKNLTDRVEDVNYRIEHFMFQLTKIKEEIVEVESKIANENVIKKRLLDSLQTLIKVSLNKNVKIKL